jgi:hypothetical protein
MNRAHTHITTFAIAQPQHVRLRTITNFLTIGVFQHSFSGMITNKTCRKGNLHVELCAIISVCSLYVSLFAGGGDEYFVLHIHCECAPLYFGTRQMKLFICVTHERTTHTQTHTHTSTLSSLSFEHEFAYAAGLF